MNKMVMCVHKDDTGFNYQSDKCICWVERHKAEENSNFRQVIPYCAVRRPDGKLLVYERAGNEDRLHGLLSFGIGGHIDEGETVIQGMRRELHEEADVQFSLEAMYLGKIILEETQVDRVHIGLAFTADVLMATPQEELLNPCWLTIEEIGDRLNEFEPWSKVLHGYIAKTF